MQWLQLSEWTLFCEHSALRPCWSQEKVSYLSCCASRVPNVAKKEFKLELAASMIRQVVPEFQRKEHVVLLCDSWYTKHNLVSVTDEYLNLDLIGNAKIDSVMYDPTPKRTNRRGHPAKHEKLLFVETDFLLSDEKIDGYYAGVHRLLTKVFGDREVLACVTVA